MAREDQEDEFFEKDPDEVIPAGFHIVDEEEEKKEHPLLGILPEDEEAEEDLDEELEVETGPGEFGGKEFDFEHAEEE